MGYLEEDYKGTLKEFIVSGDSNIKTLYNAIPYMDGSQQQILVKTLYIAHKYNLQPLIKALEKYEMLQKENRHLGYSWKGIIQAVSLHDNLKGFKFQASSDDRK